MGFPACVLLLAAICYLLSVRKTFCHTGLQAYTVHRLADVFDQMCLAPFMFYLSSQTCPCRPVPCSMHRRCSASN